MQVLYYLHMPPPPHKGENIQGGNKASKLVESFTCADGGREDSVENNRETA